MANHALEPLLESHAIPQRGIDRAALSPGSVCVVAVEDITPVKSREFLFLQHLLQHGQGRLPTAATGQQLIAATAATGQLIAAPCLPLARHRERRASNVAVGGGARNLGRSKKIVIPHDVDSAVEEDDETT